MEIKVTKLIEEYDMSDFSASKFELGDDAPKITWENAIEAAPEFLEYLSKEVNEADLLKEVVGHCREYGVFEDLDKYSKIELTALLIQDIAAAYRAREDCEGFEDAGRIYESEDGEYYYYLGI